MLVTAYSTSAAVWITITKNITFWRASLQGDGVWLGHEYPKREQILARAVSILRAGKKPVDPYSPQQLRWVHAWQKLGRLRRYILFIYRHLPWNRGWLKENIVTTNED